MNNKSIQILRGSESYDPSTSEEVLLAGQPFYSKKTKQLYIGECKKNEDNSITNLKIKELKPITSWLQSGDGENSVQQVQNESFSFETPETDNPYVKEYIESNYITDNEWVENKYFAEQQPTETSAYNYEATSGAFGDRSIDLGWGNQVQSAAGFAEGYRNIIASNGVYGLAFGNQNLIEGRASGGIGISNHILSNTSSNSTSNVAIGSLNEIGGISNATIGNDNIIGSLYKPTITHTTETINGRAVPNIQVIRDNKAEADKFTQFNLIAGQHNEILGGQSNFVSGNNNTVKVTNKGSTQVKYNIVSGCSNTIQGINFFGNAVFGENNSIVGYNNTSRNLVSGYNNIIDGSAPILFSSIVGESNKLYSGYSHVFGSGNTLGTKGSQSNVARAFIAGQSNTYTGTTHGYIFGKTNTSNGSYTTIFGVDNKNTNGYYCTTLIGDSLIASNDYQFIIGKYNYNNSDAVFQIGRGSADDRKNIFEISANGSITKLNNLNLSGNISQKYNDSGYINTFTTDGISNLNINCHNSDIRMQTTSIDSIISLQHIKNEENKKFLSLEVNEEGGLIQADSLRIKGTTQIDELTSTGNVTIDAKPSNSKHAVRKQELDAAITDISKNISTSITTNTLNATTSITTNTLNATTSITTNSITLNGATIELVDMALLY